MASKRCKATVDGMGGLSTRVLGVRTQTEYDEYLVNESQIVIGLFKNRCGKYTQEEIVNAIKASTGDKGKLPVAIYLEKGSLLLNNSKK